MADHTVSLVYFFLSITAVVLFYRYEFSRLDENPSLYSVRPLPRQLQSAHPISMIIPTLREAAQLPGTVSKLFEACTLKTKNLQCSEPTVIVVDAGHSNQTRLALAPLLEAHPALHLVKYPGPPSRGVQQNFGVARATALSTDTSILVFLHADTLLPRGWDEMILSTLSSNRPPALGTFSLSLPHPISLSLQVMLWGANIRARWGQMPYGDQTYFLARETFEAVGGFPDVPIMEDVELLRRIRNHVTDGRVMVLEAPVITSPRRWNKKGVLWNTVLNQVLIISWMCGLSHETIYRWYYGHRPQGRTTA